MMKTVFDFVIIGGGAAGFFAAMTAAEAKPGLRVAILEKSHQTLAKVKVSGGGRCNLTHACFDPQKLCEYYPRGKKELIGPFHRFQPRDTIAWFERRGVKLKIEPDGRVFPVSNSSETIIDCLQREVCRLGIIVQTGRGVSSVTPHGGCYEVTFEDESRLLSEKVLLAPGGGHRSAYALAEKLGHSIVPPVPSLFTFKLAETKLTGLAGISVPSAEIKLKLNPKGASKSQVKIIENGPVLVTHWGVSGPAVLKLSALGARWLYQSDYQAELIVNWVWPRKEDHVFQELSVIKQSLSRKIVRVNSPFSDLPDRLWSYLIGSAGIGSSQVWANLSNKELCNLAAELCGGRFHIIGRGVNKDEFVTCGGVSLREVNFQSMESKLHRGLFFAGEFLDIDGLTGGFNFQAAWTTAWISGLSAARSGKNYE